MKITPVKGTNDYLSDDVDLRDFLQNEILKVYKSYGFMRISTPIIEDIENLDKSEGGENLNLIFKILKRGGKLENYINYRIYFFYVLRLYDLKMRESLFDFNYYNDPNILIGNGNTINYTEGCTSNKFIIKNMINNENNLYSNQDWKNDKKSD